MGQEINPHQKQALILQFDPETRDERLAELMSLAASEELSLLSVSFVGGEYEDAGQGRMLVIVLG